MKANLRANQNICSVIVDDGHELIPLKLEYVGEMNGGILSLQIHQLYKNDQGDASSPDSKAVLVLPKNQSHCITGIECFLNDQKIDIKIEEEKTAKEIAKEAEKQGRTTIRSDSTPDDQHLRIKLGSIKFGSEFKITIRMEIISTNSDSNTYQTIIPFSEQTLDPSIQDNFTFSIVFNEIVPISNIDITCSHKRSDFKHTFDGSLLTIDKKPLSTIVVLTKLSEKIESVIQNDIHDEYSVISVMPNFLNKPINSDFIFIVDCSYSMSGSRIQNASECLSIFLHSLPVGCNFNIIMFGSNYRSVFGSGGLVEYNEANLKKADESVKEMRANLGGTKLLRPLSFAYNQIESVNEKGKVCQIFLLTDGEIHDTETVFKLVNKNRTKSRIFSIGIGNDADRNLVSGLALLSFGKFDFVSESSQITDKVINLLSLSLSPALTNIAVHASTADGGEIESIEIVPNPMTTIYDGNLATIYIKRDAKEKLIENVLITGKVGDEEIEIVVDETINSCELSAKNLFAFNAIRDYEKLYENLEETERRGFSSDDNELAKLKDRIVTLSIECGILSKFTSYIGVESESHRNPLSNQNESSSGFEDNRIGSAPMATDNQVEGVVEIVESECGRKHRRKRGTMEANDGTFISDGGHVHKRRHRSQQAQPAAPVETAPVEAAPIEAAPVEAAPVEAAPAPTPAEPPANESVEGAEEIVESVSGRKRRRNRGTNDTNDGTFISDGGHTHKRRHRSHTPAETPATETKTEEPKPEESKQEQPKPEEPKKEQPKPEEPKKEELKPEEPKQEKPKREETSFDRSRANRRRNKKFSYDADYAPRIKCKFSSDDSFDDGEEVFKKMEQECYKRKSKGSNRSHRPPPPKAPRIENSVTGIVLSLNFDGRWKSELLEQFLEFAGEKGSLALNSFFESLKLNDDDENKGDIESTIAALCVLHASFLNENSKWKIAAMKAIGWLNSKLLKQWQTEIQQLVSSF